MSEERMIRTGPRKGFVVLYRSAAQDARLSLEARGMLVMMASLPDNWSYSETGLASKAGCGRQKVNRILRRRLSPAGAAARGTREIRLLHLRFAGGSPRRKGQKRTVV